MSGSGDGDESLTAVLVAVSVNLVITVAKYVGWFLTWSPALLAEAIHSTADVGNQFLLWIGLRQSAKEATPEHPYGHGPARYVWNLKSAMGIFFLGCGVTLYHGLYELHHALRAGAGGGSHDEGWIGLAILLGAFLLEGFSLLVAIKGIAAQKGDMGWLEFMREGDDPTGVGVLLEDLAAVFGVLVAFVGVGLSKVLHSPYPDIAATLVIGLLLGYVAIFLARANSRLLIGAAVSQRQIDAIQAALEADEMVELVRDLKTEIIGQGRIRVKCEIDLYEKLIAKRMLESLKQDVAALKDGEDPNKVLVDVVGRAVRVTGKEIMRLEAVILAVAPNAAHIDLELI